MAFGDNVLQRGDGGAEVTELQLRLAGFRGTIWDGFYGPGLELQVIAFQRDYMNMANPTGTADLETLAALQQFAQEFPLDFAPLKCPCGRCNGFGNRRYPDDPRNKEYPGIHKAILHAFRAAQFYAKQEFGTLPFFTSGYRCWVRNQQKERGTTNHMGKALDCDIPLQPSEDKMDDRRRCDRLRAILVEKSNFQIGWLASNRKALEPSDIAPTWIHMDVRCYAPEYLADVHFVTSLEQLDNLENITASSVQPQPAPAAVPAAPPRSGTAASPRPAPAAENPGALNDVANILSKLDV